MTPHGRYERARSAHAEAAARLSPEHWRADALVHVSRLGARDVARRMGVSTPAILEMVAEVRHANRLGEDAADLRLATSWAISDAGGCE